MQTTGQGSPRDGGSTARPLVIANPAARRGRTGRDLGELLEPLRGALGDLDIAVTTHAGHAQELAAAAAGELRPLVVSLGGDGTLNEVVNGLLDGPPQTTGAPRSDSPGSPAAPEPEAAAPPPQPPPASSLPRLGIVATGTGGDFGRSLGIPHRFAAYVAALASGRERPVDVGLARFTGRDGSPQQRFWINVLSGGIGGLVDIYNETAPHWMSGRLAYGQAAFRGIFTCKRVTLSCRSVLADGRADERLMHAHAVAVCNGHTFGGGMLIAPEARPDDGLLQVVSFETRTRSQLLGRFLTVYRGTHVLEEGVNSFVCRSLELTPAAGDDAAGGGRPGASGPRPSRHGVFPLDIDGDARGDVPLAVELVPGALLVRA